MPDEAPVMLHFSCAVVIGNARSTAMTPKNSLAKGINKMRARSTRYNSAFDKCQTELGELDQGATCVRNPTVGAAKEDVAAAESDQRPLEFPAEEFS